ncbi:SgcJ/EcaC family oxidoreductase [Mucilaginibacter polytrichastri]|uniref:SnoaL-like domain-containing protein n=1 Tax=Mucilaginibacter polytrichastri TaxID=1302689 RepID=A0A1Q5ZXD6_9SPHI|nr:SgcJ/EcaC family oxidoreductase [Mucilaginibacter polytrichastri]OKS86420.1 hypothetical protein RG47T_1876 [Mucilaginibacter polytrichastri]SFT27536.1 conserved hypothetical protein [Mucilaginibacter polytrichastri]
MKTATIILLIFALITPGIKAQTKEKDEKAVRETIARFGNSWAKGNFSDMVDYMTPDCNWINIVGMQWKGLKEVQYAHQFYVSSMFKGIVPQTLDSSIRFITPDVAIAYWKSHMPAFYPPDGVNRGGNKHDEADDIATIVLVKKSNKWYITSAQNVSVIAQAAPSNPVLHMDK